MLPLQLLPLAGDLHDTVALLAAGVAQRALPGTPAELQALAQALRAARYAVIVGAPGALPAQGALVIEAVHRWVDQLNGHTRAAALWLGGGEGAATANQVFAWLSGLPLRSRKKSVTGKQLVRGTGDLVAVRVQVDPYSGRVTSTDPGLFGGTVPVIRQRVQVVQVLEGFAHGVDEAVQVAADNVNPGGGQLACFRWSSVLAQLL